MGWHKKKSPYTVPIRVYQPRESGGDYLGIIYRVPRTMARSETEYVIHKYQLHQVFNGKGGKYIRLLEDEKRDKFWTYK